MTTGPVRSRQALGALLSALALVAAAVAIFGPVRMASSERGPHTTEVDYPVIAAAGDISCSTRMRTSQRVTPRPPDEDKGVPAESRPAKRCAAHGTALLLKTLKPAAVLPLGDLQYECGETDDFHHAYDATWGQFRSISYPAVGNHEYGKACGHNDASDFFSYFHDKDLNAPKGWFSFDIGSWHLIALNSQCSSGEGEGTVGGCGRGSDQLRWLRADLAVHDRRCTLAYWHEPRFSSGHHGSAVQMTDIWNVLVDAHVDVVLSGHNHGYERFGFLGKAEAVARRPGEPVFQDPTLDPKGIQQFVVGTGGKNHYPFAVPPLNGEEVREASTFGVLALTLKPDGYDWRFVPVRGSTFHDEGSRSCR
jgi:hypothetical protein